MKVMETLETPMNLRNIVGNVVAFVTFILSVFPNFTLEAFIQSIQTGEIFGHLYTLGVVWLSYDYGKEKAKPL